jgi:autocrine motility factor receptor
MTTLGLADFLLLPSLKWYTIWSMLCFGGFVVLASHQSDLVGFKPPPDPMDPEEELGAEIHWMAAVVCVNMAACVLLLFALAVTRLVFGELRTQELNAAKDKFWNFVFYKFIFVFGVINVQQTYEVMAWAAWFAILAFLVVMTKISKLRFDHLSFSPNTASFLHFKVLSLLGIVILFSMTLFVTMLRYYSEFNIQTLAFLLAEVTVIMLKSIHVVSRYLIHLYDLHYVGLWEYKGRWLHYNDLVLCSSFLFVNLLHHLHMLLSGNLWLSMASLVICMHIRFLLNELQKQYNKHQTYHRVVFDMEYRYPHVKNEGECLICWESFSSARQLSCGHCFHGSCLRLWLEQDASCPTCRRKLNSDEPEPTDNAAAQEAPVWQINLRSISRWLPSLQVTVNYDLNAQPMNETRLQASVTELMQIFPHISRRALISDLRETGSADLTTDHILDGQLDEIDSDSDQSDSSQGGHQVAHAPGQLRQRHLIAD